MISKSLIDAHGEVPTVAEEHFIPSPTPPTPRPQPPQDIHSTSQVQHTPPQSPQEGDETREKEQGESVEAKKVGTSQRVETYDDTVMDDEYNLGRTIVEMDQDDAMVLKDDKVKDKDVADVVKDAKEAKVDENANETCTAASAIITTAKAQVPPATTATRIAAPVRVTAAPSRRRKRVIIRVLEEDSTTSTIIPAETKSQDKGKGILVEEPKPLKKKQQIEHDEQYARELHVELNKDINWDEAIDHVKLKAKEDPTVKRYQVLKRKPQTKAQARENMMIYLKNVAGFKLIEPNEDDDVYTEATPLASNVPIVDYEIIEMKNKPYYKIIRADETYQLFISFLTFLRNIDREDLEALWSLVKERFSTTKPKNFSDDFLLTTLGEMQAESQVEIYKIDMDHALKVLSMQEDEPAEVQEFPAASTIISTAEPQVPVATITAAPVRVVAAYNRRRKGVVIRDPEEESTTIIPGDTKSKDKGKGIMVEEPKPLKKKQQVEMDEEYQDNDVTRLQALVDKKKVVVIEAAIREVLRLNDAEGVDCLPNEEIFAELARMGYEKPSTKLTFYKAFFSSQKQVGDLSTHTTKYTSPALTQKVFANMRRVEKGFSGVETPLFEGMIVGQEIEEGGDVEEHVKDVTIGDAAQGDDIAAYREVPTVSQEPSIPSPTPPTPSPQPPQDLPSTSHVQHTPPQSPQAQPQTQPQPQPQQTTDFPMSLLQETLDAYAALTRRVEHLEYDKVAQALEIKKLKRRVKKLEKGNRVKVLKLRRLKRVKTSLRVDTSEDTVMDDASNQGRIIDEL
nr:hypothetical protein [Tanacetum cinerariifolium]